MKAEIHPAYSEIKVSCSCGNEFTTRSTLGEDLAIEVCSASIEPESSIPSQVRSQLNRSVVVFRLLLIAGQTGLRHDELPCGRRLIAPGTCRCRPHSLY